MVRQPHHISVNTVQNNIFLCVWDEYIYTPKIWSISLAEFHDNFCDGSLKHLEKKFNILDTFAFILSVSQCVHKFLCIIDF
jgi:hypothetical protein